MKKFLEFLKKLKNEYFNSLLKSNEILPTNFNENLFKKYLKDDNINFIINALIKDENVIKSCEFLIYGYIENNIFHWIKNFNKIFLNIIKEIKIFNEKYTQYSYFFNKTTIKLKNTNFYHIIPYIVYYINPLFEVIQFEDVNKTKMFGLYKIC